MLRLGPRLLLVIKFTLPVTRCHTVKVGEQSEAVPQNSPTAGQIPVLREAAL